MHKRPKRLTASKTVAFYSFSRVAGTRVATDLESRVSPTEGEGAMQSEFLHNLRDTVLLLGLERYFADLLDDTAAITEADIEALRAYNRKLIDATKSRLHHLNRLSVTVAGQPQP